MLMRPYRYTAAGGVALTAQYKLVDSDTCIRVRRESDSAEADFTGTEIGDGTLVAWTGSGAGTDGYVTTWYNTGTGGSTYDLVQTTAANQPRISSDGTVDTDNNGNAVITFDGSNDELATSGSVVIPDSDNMLMTWFAVGGCVNSGGHGGFLFQKPASYINVIDGWFDRRTNKTIGRFRTTTGFYTMNTVSRYNVSDARIIAATADATNCYGYYNGSLEETVAMAGNNINIGGNVVLGRSSASAFGNVTISEVRIYGGDNDDNYSTINSDLNSTYSVYV